MGERYVDVGKVRSRSGPLRSVRAPAHPARPQPPLTASVHGLHSQPPPQPPLTASATTSAHSLRPLRGLLHRARSYSGSESVQGAQRAPAGGPPPAPPGLSETPGGPRTPGGRHRPTLRHAAERSAKSSSGVAECPAGHRAGSPRRAPRRPASSQFLYQGSPPRSLSETARVRSRACRISRFTPASAIDTASCRSS